MRIFVWNFHTRAQDEKFLFNLFSNVLKLKIHNLEQKCHVQLLFNFFMNFIFTTWEVTAKLLLEG